MDYSFHSWQVFAFWGLCFYVVSRLARGRRTDATRRYHAGRSPDILTRMARSDRTVAHYQGFGVWLDPPRWARVLFGGWRGRVRWDDMSWEVMSLVSFGLGSVGWILQPPSRSILFVTLVLPIVGSALIMVIVLAVVVVGRKGRL